MQRHKEIIEYECHLCKNVYSKLIDLKYHKYEVHNKPLPKPRAPRKRKHQRNNELLREIE